MSEYVHSSTQMISKRLWKIMKYKAKKIVITLLLMIVLVIVLVSVSNTQNRYVDKDLGLTIYADSREDFVIAQKSAIEAYKFFAKHGYTEVKPIIIRFQEKVIIKITETETSRIYGCYDKGQILMTKRSAAWLNERKIFGLDITNTLHKSIITHEITHSLLSSYSGGIKGHGVHEYVAYASQIQSLPKDMIKLILSNHQGNFSSENSINSIVHLLKPRIFGALSFKHYLKTKGALIPRIINKEFNPDEDLGGLY